MSNNQNLTERSGSDNLLFGVLFCGLLLGATGVILTTPGIAIAGLALIGIGLSYFGLKQMLNH